MLQMARLFLCAFILISPISLGLAHAATCEDGYYLHDGATECQPNPEPEFIITTIDMVANTDFTFKLSAAGTFYIDWGDGNIQTITKNDTTNTTYSHTYESADTYIIGLSGQATEYNTDEQTAAISFMSSASRIASIDGSLGAIFGTLSDGAQIQPRFYNTFYNAFNMNCSIPENLFDGIFGAPISYMFYSTFLGCNGLIGSIPKDLFARIFGRPADSMFAYTFYGCSGLIDSIPENLFAGISGAPASYMFYGTFEGCSGLTGSIPSGLFGKIEGVPAKAMFHNTFSGCSGLTGSIPSGLFGNLSGSPAESMFYGTFADCSGLAGEIPSGLFGDLTGSPASNMFNTTFYNCSGLTSIPSGLFGAINGNPASRMFKETFAGCTGLRGGIPDNLFGNLSGNLPVYGYSFTGTFADCIGLTGSSAKIKGRYLYEIWPDADEYSYLGATGLSDYRYIPTIWGGLGYTLCKPGEYMPSASTECLTCKPGAYCVGGEFIYNDTTDQGINKCPANSTSDAGATECKCNAGFTIDGLPDGAISTTDVKCMPKPEFSITTTDDTETFSFRISAAGSYTINWGDGSIENITKDNTADTTYSHTYESADTYTIGLSGQATAYITGVPEAAVSFSGNENIVSIDGSLGAVFGTLSDGTNPLFLATFSDCVGLTAIPDDLFSGITGSRKYMFTTTFNGCTGLTSIPENLFSGITGSAPELFFSTFSGCTGLTSIPEKLFSGISGAASSMFSHTFRDCEFLKSIPDKLFSTVSGAAATMFHGTFSGCTGLTSIPENLFSGITGPAESMFWYTFSDCTGLTSIPEKLFSGISGTASGMFMTTFNNCAGLTEIPENLFSGITEGAYGLFSGTFSGCTALKSIPENLFSNISSSALQMFSSTFAGCSSLTSIPGRLFSNVKASAEYMFDSTFSLCSGLTQIGDGLFGGVSDGAKGMFSYTFRDCTALTDIPGTLFKNLSGAAESMFAGTFSGCDGLRTVPGNLFGKITSVAPGMFSSTFNSCQNLTSIPVDLFASITGTPADRAFDRTFAWSENIKEFVDSNGQSVSYIPVEFFSRMSKPTTYNKNMFEYVFAGTDLDESCPSGTIKATPYYANEVAPKVVCIPAEVSCAPGEYVSESGAECQQCPENNICRGDWSEPESCHDLTNGEYPYSDAGRSDISDCYRTCDEYSLDECNLRPIDKFKAYYGEQCEYSCKTNNGFPCDIIDNQCHEIICPNAYEYINGECVPCTRDHAIAFKDALGCKVDTCEQDYHPDDEICAPDTILCSAPHAQTAVQEWDNNKKLYSKCMILECVPDWHVESNACVPDEESCENANGTGVREWNHQTNSWGECIATRCDPGYTNDSSQTNEAWNQCGRCNNAYSAGGELAASSYVNECEIASCLYQGELYTLENNECRLICDEYSDETGRRYWDSSRKKCVHDCAAGYANW